MASSSLDEEPYQGEPSTIPQLKGTYNAIILWDLDETLIALRSQLRQKAAVRTVGAVEVLLESYLDQFFYYNLIEEFDPENICDYLKIDDLHKRQHTIEDSLQHKPDEFTTDMTKYLKFAVTAYHADSASHLSPTAQWMELWTRHLNDLDALCNQWTAEAGKLLARLSEQGCLHVAVTNTRLVAALAKLKLWGLSSFFEPQWIYSSSRRGKHAVFCRALQSAAAEGIGPQVVVAVGDGPEEEAASMAYQLPFVKIRQATDLSRVHQFIYQTLNLPFEVEDVATATSGESIESVELLSVHVEAIESTKDNRNDREELPEPQQSPKRVRTGSL